MLLAMILIYSAIGQYVAFTLADMNHHKWPRTSEWLVGLLWLPAILFLAFGHLWYKKS